MMKEKDGRHRGRGSGHHSLSQLTGPAGVAGSLLLGGDRRRGISWRINLGSSFHCRADDTEGDRSLRWRGGGQ